MGKKKNFMVRLDSLYYDIHVLYGYDEKSAQKYCDKNLSGLIIEKIDGSCAQCRPITYRNGNQAALMIFWEPLKKNDVYSMQIIIHEALHCVIYAHNCINVDTINESNCGFYCYNAEYIFGEIYKGLFIDATKQKGK